MKSLRKWFTLIEMLITVTILSMLSIPVFDYIKESRDSNFNNLKIAQSVQLWNNLVNKVVNIRDSSWIESSNRDVTLDDFAQCSPKLDADFWNLILWNSYWWFCNEVDSLEWKALADLDWTYSIVETQDILSKEYTFKFSKVPDWWYSWYKYIDVVTNARFWWNITEQKLEDFFADRQEDLSKLNTYDKYKSNKDLMIPKNLILYTLSFSDVTDSDVASVVDLSRYSESEKNFFLSQSKKVRIEIEYSLIWKKREKLVLEKILTNYQTD